MDNKNLIAACDRLLQTEQEVKQMPKEQSDWFFGKAGHSDCFLVARELKSLLMREVVTPTEEAAISNDAGREDFTSIKLPNDIKIGATVFKKGLPLSAIINAAERWNKLAAKAFNVNLKDVGIPHFPSDCQHNEIEDGKS